MKKILISAGGTATAWHITNLINQYFKDDFEIHICDINADYLIPASTLCYQFHKVPKITDNKYTEEMLKLMKEEEIDIFVPLIDFDLEIFPKDSKELKKINVFSTAPTLNTTLVLSNKKKLEAFLKSNNLPYVPSVKISNIKKDKEYVLKPIQGFGSRGVEIKKGYEINNISENFIIQEKCEPTEITAEVFNGEKLYIFLRERVEVKSGVCTKMVPIRNDIIEETIKKLVNLIEMPTAFCIQFMKYEEEWKIIDCNLRLGAGTALSTSIGFQLTRAFLATLCNKVVKDEWFIYNKDVKAVLRVYKEINIYDNNI